MLRICRKQERGINVMPLEACNGCKSMASGCIDNVQPGALEAPGAGRGALVTCSLSKGSIAAPGPLLHITNKARVAMCDVGGTTNVDEQLEWSAPSPANQQLLVSCCFGCASSSLLLSLPGFIASLISQPLLQEMKCVAGVVGFDGSPRLV